MPDVTDVCISAGVYDLLHNGHLDLFRRMREVGKRVVVIVHDDHSTFLNKGKFPVQDGPHRWRNIQYTGLVDEVVITSDQNPIEAIRKIVARSKGASFTYMRGDDWKDAPGLEEVRAMGIPIVFKPYLQGISSTELRTSLPSTTD